MQRVPGAVWAMVTLAFILALPLLNSTVAFSAVISISTVGLYISCEHPYNDSRQTPLTSLKVDLVVRHVWLCRGSWVCCTPASPTLLLIAARRRIAVHPLLHSQEACALIIVEDVEVPRLH